MIREIAQIGAPVLNSVCREVTRFDKSLETLIGDMIDTMIKANGVGLAANQIYVPLRIFTYLYVDYQSKKMFPSHIINPVVLKSSVETSNEVEGCLSVRSGIFSECKRSKVILIKGQDITGKKKILYGEGLLASCIQHEIDHLNGGFYLHRISKNEDRVKNIDSVILDWRTSS